MTELECLVIALKYGFAAFVFTFSACLLYKLFTETEILRGRY